MKASDKRSILAIPEIIGLDARSSIIRIPPELDVPLTPRVRRIIDSKSFRRLAHISQLGFVRLVYPGATHTRFEHSLGVYRLTLLILKRLAHDPRFSVLVDSKNAELLILAALLHDLGHFPFCHLLEDLKLPGLLSHEAAAEEFICGELNELIRSEWDLEPEFVCDVLQKRAPRRRATESDDEYAGRLNVFRLLASILSGPIDVDKMDYLMRDSCGAGVPYGKNYDIDRLVGSICLNRTGDGIAITNKGKTAAELMVFARYVMFSEVYWHHASRAATVMFQRAVHNLALALGTEYLVDNFRALSDTKLQSYLFECCDRVPQSTEGDVALKASTAAILNGLFGAERKLFKRALEFNAMEAPEIYSRLSGKPYSYICSISAILAEKLRAKTEQILIDAPPVDKEVEFKIDVYYPREDVYRPLSDVSPVVRTLAREQFDDYVKRVRIFAAPEVASSLRNSPQVARMLAESLDDFD